MYVLPVILLNFSKSKIGLSHVNVCDVCKGEEVSSLPIALCEESNNIFLLLQSLGSEEGFCQKRAWDGVLGVLLKTIFPPENTYFLVLVEFGALGCILRYFESNLTDN